ncbi:dynamin family protein [Janibacter massiliensis]|uniref:dynamin family protein n=1 Tax=Janibacter massiliensis TaxID=2058291 RepID=UPI000D114401|nr:dynamin family protein [Janibacter massiliensis]
MTAAAPDTSRLLASVQTLRDEVDRTQLPLDLPSTAEAKANRAELLRQLDDYVIPRLESIDAPLLAVIGGSTGAGKSTLVNSILRREVSRAGVLRPTTTSPVLIHHPEDLRWFRNERILPELGRVTGQETEEGQPNTVRLVESSELPAGMALLDAPDIDSVVAANRGLARQLLSAADLWLFVTTAARYADAVPWDLLRQAADRGTAVAIVLDRVPREAMGDIREHLTDMLREQGLGTSPVFTVPETELEENGLLPDEAIARLRGWLSALASDTRARSIVIRQTLSGALSSLDVRVDELVAAARLQQTEAETLRSTADTAYAAAEEGVRKGVADGQLLRGEVLARWQEYVGTGEFLKKIESGVAKLRDRLTSAVKGQPAAQQNLDEALHSGVAELILAHADDAAATTTRTWRGSEAGEAIVARHPDLTRSSTELPPRVDRIIREWQGELLDLIRAEGGNRRTNARIAAYGVNGIGLFLMLIVFSHTAGLTGAEIGIAGGTTVLAQKVLEAVFGDQAVREMAAKGRRLLLEHVADLYDGEQARYGKAIDEVAVNDRQVRKLENAVAAVKEAS